MNTGDKYDLTALLKDLAVQLRYIRNSNQAAEFAPVLVHAACELELMVKGAMYELNELECTEEDANCTV
jgi:hypothetical protein